MEKHKRQHQAGLVGASGVGSSVGKSNTTMSRNRRLLCTALYSAVLSLGIAAGEIQAQHFSPWSPAVNLGPVVNTLSTDGCPVIAKSDLTLYVVSNRPGGSGGLDIYVSQRDSVYDPWGPAVNLGPTINSASGEFCPTLTIDGNWLLFHSDRPGGCGGSDMYVAHRHNKRDDFGWEAPVNLGCTVNSASNDIRPSFQEGDGPGQAGLYFSSDRPGGLGGIDIYFSSLDSGGTFAPPVLVLELSTSFQDLRPNVRKDGLEIFFDSNRPGSLMDSFDLWVSTRDSTAAPWSLPVHLGAIINSNSNDGGPSLSFDGTTLYFFSPRPGGIGGIDTYVATRTKLRGPE